MKYFILILTLSACSKSIPTPSDELIITSNQCIVQYTLYRITSNTPDSLQFVLKDVLDCRFEKERRCRIEPGDYELHAYYYLGVKEIRFLKKAEEMQVNM
jgi:hypothetical protein